MKEIKKKLKQLESELSIVKTTYGDSMTGVTIRFEELKELVKD